MPTFQYDENRLVRLFDHGEGGWEPEVERGARMVAGVRFPVKPTDEAAAKHFVMHSREEVRNVLGDEIREVLVIHCSNQNSISGEHEKTESGVILRMKDRAAFEKVDKWLPQFLRLDVDTASKIAMAGNAESRVDLADLESGFGHLLDVVCPWPMKEVLPALAILCHGFLAVWASDAGRRQEGDPWINGIDAARKEKKAEGVTSLLANLAPGGGVGGLELANKWDDVRHGSWWRDCFGATAVKTLVEKEVKGTLDKKPKLDALTKWIDNGTATPNEFEKLVAEAYLEIREELKPNG